MSTTWRKRSSTDISERDRDTIRRVVSPTVASSRRLMHSPAGSPVPAAHCVLTADRVHVSKFLGARVNVGCQRAKRRAMWALRRRLFPRTGTSDKESAAHPRILIYVRDFGRFAPVHAPTEAGAGAGLEIWCWIGAALLRICSRGWWVVDVTGPCRVTIDYLGERKAPVRRVNVYNDGVSCGCNPGDVTSGKLVWVRVERPGTCFRRVSGGLDSEVVKHWAPFSRIIYAKCADVQSGDRVLARVDTTNRLHCLYCERVFGRSVADLCAHLGLRVGAKFETHVTP